MPIRVDASWQLAAMHWGVEYAAGACSLKRCLTHNRCHTSVMPILTLH